MKRALVLLAALATLLATLLSPLALAGSENQPEVDDSRDQLDPTKDLLAAWFTSEPGGLRFTIKVASLPTPDPERLYAVTFYHNGTRHLAGVSFAADGTLAGYVGPYTARLPRGPVSTWGNDSLGLREFDSGSPARLSALIPWRAIPDLGPGQRVTNVGASVYSSTNDAWSESDAQRTDTGFAIRRTLIPSTTRDHAPLAIAILLPLIVGVATGLAWHRRATRRTARLLAAGLRAIEDAALLPPTRRAARLRELTEAHSALRARRHLDARAHHRLVVAVRNASRAPTRIGARFDIGKETARTPEPQTAP